MTINSREKGKRWEREVANRMRLIFGKDRVRRGRQAEGAAEPDIVTPTTLWLECKHGKLVGLRKALEQAERDSAQAYDGAWWRVVVAKDNGKRPIVVMPLDDFEDLISEWWGGKQ